MRSTEKHFFPFFTFSFQQLVFFYLSSSALLRSLLLFSALSGPFHPPLARRALARRELFVCVCRPWQQQQHRKSERTSERERERALSKMSSSAIAAAATAPSPLLLRRAPAVARAPRRAGALPSVSPAASPALRGLKVSPSQRERRGLREERAVSVFFFAF